MQSSLSPQPVIAAPDCNAITLGWSFRFENTDLGELFLAIAKWPTNTTVLKVGLYAQAARALAGMLAVFAEFERNILRDRVKSRIDQARKEGRPHGQPPSVQHHAPEISVLFKQGVSKRQIAARLHISRALVGRLSPARRGTSLRNTAAA